MPIKIKSLPEGSLVPIKVPLFTIVNTDPKCAWITNYLETISQTIYWRGLTSATIAFEFRKLANSYAEETCDNSDHLDFQCHDFSFRGHPALDAACVSGAGHLLSFSGSDTIPAICFLEQYYGSNVEKEPVAFSIPATEHSVACAYNGLYSNEIDVDYLDNILTKVPSGLVGTVCDTYDYFGFITNVLPKFKDRIMNRDGKLVIRPDSGDPTKIICGYFLRKTNLTAEEIINKSSSNSWLIKNTNDNLEGWETSDGKYLTNNCRELTEEEAKGSIELLFELFGGEVNSKGYKVLDSHIGLIYGDSITKNRASAIFEQLKEKGYASSNIVLGIGSYTYQYVRFLLPLGNK